MNRIRWIAYLWPGLPQLWAYGSWAGLILALTTAFLLDLLILATFGWSELLRQNLRIPSWVVFGVFWSVASVWSAKVLRYRVDIEKNDRPEDTFAEALDYYLKGDYYQTEHVLEGLLRRNLRDVDARLMLATLMRHTGRLEEAAGQLDTLSRFEGAEKWDWEIRKERQLLTDAKTHNATAA